MSEPKKSSDKIKRSARKTSAKPEAEVIDGAAVEKSAAAGALPSSNKATKPKNHTPTSQHRRWVTRLTSQNVALVIAGVAAVVALRDAGANFATSFTRVPGVKAWMDGDTESFDGE